jgi:hypothetical protein
MTSDTTATKTISAGGAISWPTDPAPAMARNGGSDTRLIVES